MLLLWRFVQHEAHEAYEGYERKVLTHAGLLVFNAGAALIQAAPVFIQEEDEIICNRFLNKRITNRSTQVSSYELTTD